MPNWAAGGSPSQKWVHVLWNISCNKCRQRFWYVLLLVVLVILKAIYFYYCVAIKIMTKNIVRFNYVFHLQSIHIQPKSQKGNNNENKR